MNIPLASKNLVYLHLWSVFSLLWGCMCVFFLVIWKPFFSFLFIITFIYLNSLYFLI